MLDCNAHDRLHALPDQWRRLPDARDQVCRALELDESAIIVEAGGGKEDRLMSGSYLELREQEAAARRREEDQKRDTGENYLPKFLR